MTVDLSLSCVVWRVETYSGDGNGARLRIVSGLDMTHSFEHDVETIN